MKKDFWCRIGLHDWEELDSDFFRKHVKRICMKCKQKEDTLTPMKEAAREAGRKQRERNAEAWRLWLEG